MWEQQAVIVVAVMVYLDLEAYQDQQALKDHLAHPDYLKVTYIRQVKHS